MSCKLIAGAAGLLLLGAAASAGLAQAQDRDRGPGGDSGRGPGAGNAREAPRAAPQRAPNVERNVERSRPQAEPRVQRERAPQPRSVERPQRERAQRAEPRQRDQNAPQRVERQRSEPKRDAKREAPRPDAKQAAPKQDQAPNRAARQNDGPDRNQARNPERQDRQQVNRVQANNEQRVRVRERIFGERGINRVSRKDFGVALTVGNHVHRRHRLHRLTPAILAFAPFYRDYSYVVVDDDICIVDPETYVIVDVIPSSLQYAEGPQRPQLALSADEMHFIYASVPKDRTADVRIRLALGAEIPTHVNLELFPESVIERVPQIEAYRYIVVDDDVVVVDPYDREVALVITE